MPQSPALHVEHEKLHNQLQELAGLRQELQVLYEKTHAELQASRSEAALERGLREAATADNAALRRWNTQLGEELSALLAHLQDEEDDAALDSGSAAAAVAASSQLSGSAFDGGGGGVSIDGSEASGLSRANAEVLARLVRLRHGGTRHEQQVSQRLLARLMASGEPMLQHEVERLTREQEALPRPPAAAAETAAAAASPSLHGGGGGGGAPRGVRAIDGTPAADLAAAQQLELELAAATVRNTSVHARLRRTQEDLRAAVHRSSELHAGSEQLLADLTQATQRIAALEERCVAMDEEQRRRDGTARQLLERRVQQSAEMEAALQVLSADCRTLQHENVQLRLLAQRCGVSHDDLARPRRQLPPTAGAKARLGPNGAPHARGVSAAMARGLGGGGAAAEPLQSREAIEERLRSVQRQFSDVRQQASVTAR